MVRQRGKMQDTGRKYGGEKDGEETNSKEKQDEGESGRGKADFLFFFFLFQYYSLQPLDDQQQDITFWKSISRATLKYSYSRQRHCLSFLTLWYFILLSSTYSWSMQAQLPSHVGFSRFPDPSPEPQEAGGHSIASLAQASHYSTRTSLCESPAVSLLSIPIRWCVTKQTKNSALGFVRLLTISLEDSHGCFLLNVL